MAAALLLAGCRLGPDYAAPTQALPAAYRAGAAPAASAKVATDWWKGFRSPDLDTLMAEAAADSFDVRAAIARVAQADASLRAAGAALLPQISASSQASWTPAASATTSCRPRTGSA